MSDDSIRVLGTLPNGKKLRGKEHDFDPVEEKWSIYKLDDGTIVRIKTVVVAVFKVVDDDGNEVLNESGDPEIFVNTTAAVVARSK